MVSAGVFEACIDLFVTAALESGEVVLRAGETVRLGSGFRVASGVRFRIEVGQAVAVGAPPPAGDTMASSAGVLASPAGLFARGGTGALLASILGLRQPPPQRAASESGRGLFYDYFDQQIPLALVRSELGVRFEAGHQSDRPSRERSLRELVPGWEVADRFGDWTLFSTQEASGSQSLTVGVDAVEAMERIRGAYPQTYFLGPILRSNPDARLLPGPRIIVRVEEGVGAAEAEEIFEREGARIVEHPFGSSSRDYLVEVVGLDGFETLEV